MVKSANGTNGEPEGAVNDLHDSLCAKETVSNGDSRPSSVKEVVSWPQVQ